MVPLKLKKEPSFTSSCVYWAGSHGEMLLDLGVNMKATYHGYTALPAAAVCGQQGVVHIN